MSDLNKQPQNTYPVTIFHYKCQCDEDTWTSTVQRFLTGQFSVQEKVDVGTLTKVSDRIHQDANLKYPARWDCHITRIDQIRNT